MPNKDEYEEKRKALTGALNSNFIATKNAHEKMLVKNKIKGSK